MERITGKLFNKGLVQISFGNIDAGLEILEEYKEKNPVCYSTVHAQISAFKSDWQKCLEHSFRAVCVPDNLNSSNVFDDLVEMLALSTLQGGQWADLLQKVQYLIDNYPASSPRGLPKILFRLRKFAKLQGSWGHEHIRKKVSLSNEDSVQDKACEFSRKEILESFRSSHPNTMKENGQTFLYALYTYLHKIGASKEITRVYETAGFDGYIESLFFIPECYVELGEPEKAWNFLEENLFHWNPLDSMQVLPIRILTDNRLFSLLTDQRSDFILSTPKGSGVLEHKPELFRKLERLQRRPAEDVYRDLLSLGTESLG